MKIPLYIMELIVWAAVLQVILVAILGLNLRIPFIECLKFILLSWFGFAAFYLLYAAVA
jgi:hypothetical protein